MEDSKPMSWRDIINQALQLLDSAATALDQLKDDRASLVRDGTYALRALSENQPPTPDDDIFQGRGSPLHHYAKREGDWPAAWHLPGEPDDDADIFSKFAWLADDLLLRTAINIWDNGIRMPGAIEGVQGGIISAHARLIIGLGQMFGSNDNADLEQAADGVREAWLAMAKQAQLLPPLSER